MLMLVELAVSVYKVYKDQLACFHKLFVYLTVFHLIMCLSDWFREYLCSSFYNPFVLSLVYRCVASIFHSVLVSLALWLSLVLQLLT